jgi:peptide deformylase
LRGGAAPGYSSHLMSDESLLPILLVPDKRLRSKTRAVSNADLDTVRELAPRMLATMYKAPGIGLAAPQVGVMLRMAVVDIQKDDKQDPMVLINPEIVAQSTDLATREEGCLSLPNQYADVTRPARIKLRWLALDGSRQEMEADDLLATCIQHELDHLDGVLFVDHISALKRNMLLRKLAKELKNKGRDEE